MNALVFFFDNAILSGLIIGAIYALGAIGVTLIFGILRFAHFAHGDMMTMGAFLSLIFAVLLQSMGIHSPIALAFFGMFPAMAATALIAILFDKLFYKPLRDAGARPVVMVMASVGVTLMLQGVLRVFGGVSARSMYIGSPKAIFQFHLPDATRPIVLTEPQIILFVFTAVTVFALHYFLTRTRLGKAMRAVSDNPDLASITGIDIRHVVWATWIIGGALACAAGTLLSMDVALKPDLSFNILLPIFAATIVGGIGQPYGAIAGGFLVGLCESFAVFNWSILLRPLEPMFGVDFPSSLAIVPTEYKLMIPFVILIIVLIYRPTGIFKGKVL
ncbi:branched-chain amino acid ABC transporter permease [Pararhizobium mangrovi]|uniref:Branched-chain amino acid ABC transporter permease n=1 Tax=Pararhizobium mangrovi TaxID=2590452 RepID=A0A506TX18_9HYPH|nr:branched-chain amino acid ABC transporter permease [Pararhizobium mangrovi]TPW26613.1 branched-chain amino acid ABC transporter permease [Pararhizobium mangrovi]